jgi:formylglycine-generating enzyme required for sulfatase activity
VISFDAWVAMPDGARRVWLDGLLEQLPTWLAFVGLEAPPGVDAAPGAPAARLLAAFEDTRHGARFVLLPRARVTVGVTRERLLEVMATLDRAPLQVFSPEVAAPARELEVPAHLVAITPMAFEKQEWVHRLAVPRLLRELAVRGWRLPSEVEWEAHFRALVPTAPLPSMTEGELCQDDWHVGYDATLLDAEPRGRSAEVVRIAGVGPDDVRSIVPARTPLRSIGGAFVRPVIGLPGAS